MSKLIATGKWTFSFDEETGWDNDEFDTPGEALEAAREAAPEYADEEGMDTVEKAHFLSDGNVFIGQVYNFEPIVDADLVIERIQEEAREESGEYAEYYLERPPMRDTEARQTWNAQVADLEKRLTDVFREWARETKNEPNFYLIFDVGIEAIAKEAQEND